VRTRNRVGSLALVALTLAGVGCGGGGDSEPREGTPAATGEAPGCDAVPLDLASEMLKLELTGPIEQKRSNGTTCVFARPAGGASATETVYFNANESKESFAIVRDGYENNNVKVNKIKGWGDEAYAVRIKLFVETNTFAVRKGRLGITIQSVADFPEIRNLMKEILKRVS
jgi:hypothetical protein